MSEFMEQDICIEINDVSKKFGDQQVLLNVNMICRKGEIAGIIGRNGSGKSVLLKCICNLLRQDEGEIKIFGKTNIEYMKTGSRIGAVIEAPAFLGHCSGIENLGLLYGILNPSNKAHLREVMTTVGLDCTSKKVVRKYSMGMKQRLAIAQAIMENQDILLLDEPLNGLDAEGGEEICDLLFKLRSMGRTILLVSHSKEDLDKLCDCVYRLESGNLFRVL
jgi:ABC-2 type transport system ATP-binding protein